MGLKSESKSRIKNQQQGFVKRDIKLCLSNIGLIPISKHSKNMDIDRYVMGMLGPQNAITLVLKLCRFVRRYYDIHGKDHVDFNIVPLVQDLSMNKGNLVDEQYDPFSISFPPFYSDLTQHDFENKWKQLEASIKEEQKQMKNGKQVDQSFLEASPDLILRYKAALSQLLSQVDKTAMKSIVKAPQVPESHRLVTVSKDFVGVYRQFNKVTSMPREQSAEVVKQIQNIRKLINNI